MDMGIKVKRTRDLIGKTIYPPSHIITITIKHISTSLASSTDKGYYWTSVSSNYIKKKKTLYK